MLLFFFFLCGLKDVCSDPLGIVSCGMSVFKWVTNGWYEKQVTVLESHGLRYPTSPKICIPRQAPVLKR